jgi:hypothetical protein
VSRRKKSITGGGNFQQEFVAFLKKNKIPYDERWIWECFLSPLPGLASILKLAYPRLTPWAAFLRRSAASGRKELKGSG